MKNWIPFNTAQKIANIIGDDNLRFVGGVVREYLMDKKTTDFDLVTKIKPELVRDKLIESGASVYDIGIKFGTINCFFDGIQFEITTLRADTNPSGRFTDVEFCDSFEQDSLRRDFTFNALYMDLQGQIYDFHNGIGDLKNKYIRFIGDASKRIEEDYLRILRFFRFYGYYPKMRYNEDDLLAIIAMKKGMAILSAERKKYELFKIFNTHSAIAALSLAHTTGVLEVLLNSQIDWNGKLSNNPIANLLLLYGKHYDSKNISKDSSKELAKAFSLTKEEVNLCKLLAKTHIKNDADHYRLFYEQPEQIYRITLDYLNAKHEHQITPLSFAKIEFPVAGDDLIKLGYSGKPLGDKIKELKELWIQSKFSLTKEQLLSPKGAFFDPPIT